MIEHGEFAPGEGKMRETLALAAYLPVDHASATLIGRVWMRGFDGGAVVAVRRRRPTAGCSRVKQWSQEERKQCRLNRI